jgi:glutaredoxin
VSVLAVAAVAAAIVVVTRRPLEPVLVTADPGMQATRAGAAPVTRASASPSPLPSGGVEPSAVSSNAPPPAFSDRVDLPAPPAVATSKWVSEPMIDGVGLGSPGVATAAQADRARALARQQAEFESWAHREATREIEEQEARAHRNGPESEPAMQGDVLRRVPITMYSASWCGACSAARTFLQRAQIPFTERDVDTDAFAASDARRLNPKGSIPTIDVAGTTIVGFQPSAIIAAIQNAAGRR